MRFETPGIRVARSLSFLDAEVIWDVPETWEHGSLAGASPGTADWASLICLLSEDQFTPVSANAVLRLQASFTIPSFLIWVLGDPIQVLEPIYQTIYLPMVPFPH